MVKIINFPPTITMPREEWNVKASGKQTEKKKCSEGKLEYYEIISRYFL